MSERLVFYFTRIVPGYRYPVLERLNEKLDGRLVVCSGPPPLSSSLRSLTAESSHGFREIRLRNLWIKGESVHAQPFWQAFNRMGLPGAVLAEESPRSVTLPFLLRYLRRKKIPYALWGHFSSNDRPMDDIYWMNRYRIRMARKADACICYTEGISELLRPYVPEDRLFVARNTLDTDALFALYRRLEAEGKDAVRRRLGLPENEPVFIFIGRLIEAKGTGLLLDVFSRIRARVPAHLLVIGDGPARDTMNNRVAEERLEGVKFLGAIADWSDSAPYLFASDLMLMPGYLGLSVNHAFCFGVPVVSQAAPDTGIRFHSPEYEYVWHGKNGMLARYGDTEALVEAVFKVLENQSSFSQEAIEFARSHLSIDRMVNGLVEAVQYLEGR